MMEMEMKVKKIDRGQKNPTSILNANELEIISVPEEAQNNDEIDKKEENFDFDVDTTSVYLFDGDRRYTKEDLKYNFLAIKWSAWMKLSPYGVGENSRNFPRFKMGHKKWWQNGISLGWYFFACVRIAILILSTAHLGKTQNTDEKLGQMTLMIALAISCGLLMYALFSCVLSVQNVTPFLFSIFKYLDADAELQQKETRPKKFGFGLGRHTLKELLIIFLPFLAYSLAGMIPLLIAFDPSFPLLLVSLVQPEVSMSFLTLAAVDSVIFLYYYMIVHMIFYFFMGMHRIAEEAELTIKNLKKNTSSETTPTENWNEEKIKIQKALKNIRLLRIWTCFFNRSYSSVIYMVKLIALTASIAGGFGFIKMIEVENWPYAGIFALLFQEGIINYNLIFGRTFEIPEKVEELKREIRKQSFKTYQNNRFERKYVEKYLRSIPWLGVKDGVYKMERLTCPNFLCFVVEQTTDLVLAY